MVHKPVPCRLHVVLAHDAPVGVVFRRGPTEWIQVLRWNTGDDTFDPGQWFRGSIGGADLSPDGRYLFYYARKQRNWARRRVDPDVLIRWSAVSHPPYLTALALWPGGCAGFFSTNTRLVIDDSDAVPRFPQQEQCFPAELCVESLRTGGYGNRLSKARLDRDGRRDAPIEPRPGDGDDGVNSYVGPPTRLARANSADGNFEIFHDRVRNLGYRTEEYSAWDRRREVRTALPNGTEWAHWDQGNRLVWAQGGKLWALALPRDGVFEVDAAQMPIDLDPNKFEEIVSPDWARRW